jgi:hypothetical protein
MSDPTPESVDRLGFEAWADNLVVNMMENLALHMEGKSVSVRCDRYAGETVYTVSAYVAGKGWLTHSRTVPNKDEPRSIPIRPV